MGFSVLEGFLLLLAVVAAIAWFRWHQARVRKAVNAWAEENGYRVIRFFSTALRVSPFSIRLFFGKQTVRLVLVRDASGRNRVAWLLLGDLMFGMFDARVNRVYWVG